MFKKALSRDPEFKDMQRQRQMEKMIEDREKGADERELERFYEEERQKNIKKNLEEFREARKRETWRGEGNQILKQPDIFKGHKSVLHQDFEILGGKKLFMNKNGSPTKSIMMNKNKIRDNKMSSNKPVKGGYKYFK